MRRGAVHENCICANNWGRLAPTPDTLAFPGPADRAFVSGDPVVLDEIHMLNQDEGWALSGPFVLATDDGGRTWTRQRIEAEEARRQRQPWPRRTAIPGSVGLVLLALVIWLVARPRSGPPRRSRARLARR